MIYNASLLISNSISYFNKKNHKNNPSISRKNTNLPQNRTNLYNGLV
jgi:hypothetical protein